jgi:hypothetical protein
MEPLNSTATQALRALLGPQPNTAAKIGFAWKIAAGPALGRAATLAWSDDGTVTVHAASDDWRREIRRARPMIAERMQQLLGPGVVRRIVVSGETGPPTK